MTKMAIIEIGYRNYAVSMADAMKLISIAQKAVRVEQKDYRGPYYIEENPGEEPFAARMEMADVQKKKISKTAAPEILQITHVRKLGKE
ncbi:hypothetical protein Gbfr_009_019 [Gluconobacter frateurii M-2]|nr:hypothetical protein Gbfr_009_019 [Gluconobacter frateurii M-2]